MPLNNSTVSVAMEMFNFLCNKLFYILSLSERGKN